MLELRQWKRCWVLLLAWMPFLLVAVPAGSRSEASEKVEFQRIKIAVDLVPYAYAPDGKVSRQFYYKVDLNTRITPQKYNNSWFVVYVDFVPKYVGPKGAASWLDDVTMEMTVVSSGESQGKSAWCVFDGKTRFWSILLDGKKHTAMMAIPPQLLDRYLPARGNGKKISSSDVVIRVRFVGPTGSLLGDGFYSLGNASSSMTAKGFGELLRSRNAVRIPDSVFPRSATPWGIRDMDQMDLIKPDYVK